MVINCALQGEVNGPRLWIERAFKVLRVLFSGMLLAFFIAVLMTADPDGKKIQGAGGIVLFWVLLVELGNLFPSYSKMILW